MYCFYGKLKFTSKSYQSSATYFFVANGANSLWWFDISNWLESWKQYCFHPLKTEWKCVGRIRVWIEFIVVTDIIISLSIVVWKVAYYIFTLSFVTWYIPMLDNIGFKNRYNELLESSKNPCSLKQIHLLLAAFCHQKSWLKGSRTVSNTSCR